MWNWRSWTGAKANGKRRPIAPAKPFAWIRSIFPKFYFDAVANYNLQNFDAAEKSARQLQKLDTQHRYPMADRILASVLAERKDYPGAAEQMREYLKIAGTAKDADEVRGQLQQIEKIMADQTASKP